MKLPVIITILVFIVALVVSCFKKRLNLENRDLITLWGTAGALISATFIIWGYYLNLNAFRESQFPKILIFIENSRTNLITTGENVHQTKIHYSNFGDTTCDGLEVFVKLVGENEEIEIPRLFSGPMTLQARDARLRDFPTKTYFSENGVDQYVIEHLYKYKLRIGYRYKFLNKKIDRHFDYSWSLDSQTWNID